MSQTEDETAEDDSVLPIGSGTQAGGRRRARRARNVPGCLAVLVVLALIVGGVYLGVTKGVDAIKDHLTDPKDYPGPGTGKVTVQVHSGDTGSDIGRTLKNGGVVASVGAFTDAYSGNAQSGQIQPGYYAMRRQMSASGALAILVDPKNAISAALVIPEGFRVKDIVARIVAETKFTKPQVEALLKNPSQIGLPAQAKGDPQGYLFPATYSVVPGETPKQLLSQMVQGTVQAEKGLDVATKAKALGLTPAQVLVVASILEYESNNDADAAKVAQVLYNRLAAGMALQLDSTIAFITGRKGDIYTTEQEREIDSPYNTYLHTGLPPGPIGSAGEATIKAALNPTKGSWLYFLADPTTGKTLFADTFDEQQQNAAVLAQHCRDHPGTCSK